ncbi:MAG: AEC family transporter [Clostridia bacterium]|nr:AEC family transporter [Clostridia bacterium]
MDDLLFSLNTVLPLLMLMSAGWLCRRIGLLTDALVKGINQLIFRVFLPVNLFYSVLKTPYDTQLPGLAFAVIAGGLLVEFGALFLLVPSLEKDRKKIGVLIQGMGRSNYAFFGIPLVAMLFPGQDTSLAALLVIGTVPVYNVMSVIALSVYGEGKIRPGKILLNILTNPLIISSLLGYALWLLHVQLPGFLATTMNDLSIIATPLALFTLGGAITFQSAKGHLRQLLYAVPCKLLISPLIFMAVSVALGLRDVALACAFVAFGAPTAVSSFPMAQQMGGDGELAAEMVAVTSTLSVLSTFLFVFAMKSMGLI